MLECAIHPITYRGEGILATVVKGMATIRHIRIDQCHILCVDDKGNITLMMDSIHTIHFTSGVDDQYFRWSDPSRLFFPCDYFRWLDSAEAQNIKNARSQGKQTG